MQNAGKRRRSRAEHRVHSSNSSSRDRLVLRLSDDDVGHMMKQAVGIMMIMLMMMRASGRQARETDDERQTVALMRLPAATGDVGRRTCFCCCCYCNGCRGVRSQCTQRLFKRSERQGESMSTVTANTHSHSLTLCTVFRESISRNFWLKAASGCVNCCTTFRCTLSRLTICRRRCCCCCCCCIVAHFRVTLPANYVAVSLNMDMNM